MNKTRVSEVVGRNSAHRTNPATIGGHALGVAVTVELQKARSSRVLWSTGVLLAIGVTVLATAIVAAARGGDAEIVAKVGPQAATGDRSALVAVAIQITSAAGVLAFGVGISWLFGREFADGTVPGLFGLSVGRGAIATAKLLVYLAWALAVTVFAILLLSVAGLAIGLGLPGTEALSGLARLCALGVLTALIAVPAGWAASLGRGLLPGIAFAVAILVVAQVSVVADFASWVPFVAPAFWAIQPTVQSTTALAVVPLVPLIFGATTIMTWRRLELDK